MQILMIAGNVGNVKDLKDVGGDKVLNFSLAVNNGKDRDGEERDPTWYECAVWGKRAEALAPYIEKGTKLAVTGRPSARCYEDKAYLGVTVNELTFMGSATGSKSKEKERSRDDDYSYGFSGGGYKPSGPKESYDLNDDIPF